MKGHTIKHSSTYLTPSGLKELAANQMMRHKELMEYERENEKANERGSERELRYEPRKLKDKGLPAAITDEEMKSISCSGPM